MSEPRSVPSKNETLVCDGLWAEVEYQIQEIDWFASRKIDLAKTAPRGKEWSVLLADDLRELREAINVARLADRKPSAPETPKPSKNESVRQKFDAWYASPHGEAEFTLGTHYFGWAYTSYAAGYKQAALDLGRSLPVEKVSRNNSTGTNANVIVSPPLTWEPTDETTAQPLYPQIILDRLRQIANLIDSRPVMGHWPAMMTQPDADFLRSLADALKERKTHPLLAESSEETGPKPDADKAPVTSAELCPTWDRVQHKEHNGKCVYCGAPMSSQSKASEQECRSAGPSGNAAGTGPVDPGAEARSSRREVTAQNASVNPYCLQDGVPCASDGRGGCLACVDEKGTLNGLANEVQK